MINSPEDARLESTLNLRIGEIKSALAKLRRPLSEFSTKFPNFTLLDLCTGFAPGVIALWELGIRPPNIILNDTFAPPNNILSALTGKSSYQPPTPEQLEAFLSSKRVISNITIYKGGFDDVLAPYLQNQEGPTLVTSFAFPPEAGNPLSIPSYIKKSLTRNPRRPLRAIITLPRDFEDQQRQIERFLKEVFPSMETFLYSEYLGLDCHN